MVADLHLPLEIVGVPTVRDADGLALSSRNRFLTDRNVPSRRSCIAELCDLAGITVRGWAGSGATGDVAAQAGRCWLRAGLSRVGGRADTAAAVRGRARRTPDRGREPGGGAADRQHGSRYPCFFLLIGRPGWPVNVMRAKTISIRMTADRQVSGLLLMPSNPLACFVLAHGAGAGMTHSFLAAVADGFAERRIATLRYQFPYMEDRLKRPDRPAIAHAAVRAAIVTAQQLSPGLPLIAGGKSFGGRMTSQAQAIDPLPGVHGLVFFGSPSTLPVSHPLSALTI